MTRDIDQVKRIMQEFVKGNDKSNIESGLVFDSEQKKFTKTYDQCSKMFFFYCNNFIVFLGHIGDWFTPY